MSGRSSRLPRLVTASNTQFIQGEGEFVEIFGVFRIETSGVAQCFHCSRSIAGGAEQDREIVIERW